MIGKAKQAEVLGMELEAAIQAAAANDNGRIALALEYYDGTMPANDDDKGDDLRSAVSLDVADMIEAVYAQLAPAIEDVGGVEFEATSADDEPEAKRETAIVRAMLMEGYLGSGGFVAFTEAIKDALLTRRGTLALWVDRMEIRTPENWEAVPASGLAEILAPSRPGQTVVSVTTELDNEAMARRFESQDAADEAGQYDDLYRVGLTRVDTNKRLCVGAIAPENFVTSSLAERDPNLARFCADRIVTTRAKLMAEGFAAAAVLDLPRHDPTGYELNVIRCESQQDGGNAAQLATETVEVWRCYAMLADSEGSPRAERYRVYFGRQGRQVMSEPERVGRVCYAVGNVKIYPHRMDGVSLFDSIGEIQELKSRALRNWEENLHRVNRPKLAIDTNLANMADVQDSTLDVIRVLGPGAVTAVPSLDAGESVRAFLAYQDQARSERGGASLDMQTSNAQIATNQTASGIERQYSVKEQLASVMARTFAETAIRSCYLIAHYLLRTQWGGMVEAKLAGQWAQVDPSKWRARDGVSVQVGKSRTERSAKSQALGQVMAWQTTAMQSGKAGILADDSKVYNAALDWINAQQLGHPERYLIDPSSQGAQQAAQQQGAQQQRQLEAAGDAARVTLMLEKYKVDMDALTKTVGDLLKSATEEAKLTQSTIAMDEAQAQAQGVALKAAQGVGEAGEAGKAAAQ